MKKILLIGILMISLFGMGQTTERIVLVKGSSLNYKIEKSISNSTDTLTYFYFGFQNEEYQSITDIGSFLIYKKDELTLFINSLRQIASKEEGVDFSVTIGRHGQMSLYNFDATKIYIRDKNKKYTTISKSGANDIAAEIEKHINLLGN